jgi:hypothetical protein
VREADLSLLSGLPLTAFSAVHLCSVMRDHETGQLAAC